VSDSTPPTNAKTVIIEINGQQEDMIRKLVEKDSHGRSAEEIIRTGFLEFAKHMRLAKG
jgi:hypothetical protein